MSYIRYHMYTYDVVGFERNNRNIRYRTKHTTSYVHAKTYNIVYDKHWHQRHRIRYTFSNLQHRRFSLTYDIVYDVDFPEPTISYFGHTMSYVVHVRCRMFSLTYDVVYDVYTRCRTSNIRCRTCTYDVDRTYDILRTMS